MSSVSFFDTWTPDPEKLQTYVAFANALAEGRSADKEIYTMNYNFERDPESVPYYMYIIRETGDDDQHKLLNIHMAIRVHAALRRSFRQLESFDTLLPLAHDMVRNLGSKIPHVVNMMAAALVEWMKLTKSNMEVWDSVIEELVQLSTSDDLRLRRSTALTFCEMLQSIRVYLDNSNTQPLPAIIARLIAMCDDTDLTVVKSAAEALTYVVPWDEHTVIRALTESTAPQLSPYEPNIGPRLHHVLQCAIRLAERQDVSTSIKESTCTLLSSFLYTNSELIDGMMEALLDYMLECAQNPAALNVDAYTEVDTTLARIALSDFWVNYFPTMRDAEPGTPKHDLIKQRAELMASRIPQLLEVILNAFILSPQDIERAGGIENIVQEDDREGVTYDGDDDDEAKADDDEEQSQESQGVTLRRYAGMVLERVAAIYREDIASALLELVSSMLEAEDWRFIEAGLFCCGVVGPHIFKFLPSDDLDKLFEGVFYYCDNDNPLLRSISLWSLFRNRVYIFKDRPTLLDQMIDRATRNVGDMHKQVKAYAMGALSLLFSRPVWNIPQHKPRLIQVMAEAAKNAPKWSLPNLADVMSSLFNDAPQLVADNDDFKSVVSPWIERWQQAVNDPNTWMLVIPITSEILSLCPAQFPENWLEYCFEVIGQVVQQNAESYVINCPTEDNVSDEDLRDSNELQEHRLFITGALDFVSGALSSANREVVMTAIHQYRIVDAMIIMLDDPSPDLQQAIFAVIGDVCEVDVDVLKPVVDRIAPTMARWITSPEESDGATNAAWAAGRLASHLPPDSEEFAVIMNALIEGLNTPDLYDTSIVRLHNIVEALGTIAFAYPQELAASASEYYEPWIQLFAREYYNEDLSEFSVALTGVCKVIMAAPEILEAHLVDTLRVFGVVLHSTVGLSATCMESMREVAQFAMTNMPGEAWVEVMEQLGESAAVIEALVS